MGCVPERLHLVPREEGCQGRHGEAAIVTPNGSASAGTKDGGAGVIEACGDPAAPTILHQSHLRGAGFTSSFAEEAAAMHRS